MFGQDGEQPHFYNGALLTMYLHEYDPFRNIKKLHKNKWNATGLDFITKLYVMFSIIGFLEQGNVIKSVLLPCLQRT